MCNCLTVMTRTDDDNLSDRLQTLYERYVPLRERWWASRELTPSERWGDAIRMHFQGARPMPFYRTDAELARLADAVVRPLHPPYT